MRRRRKGKHSHAQQLELWPSHAVPPTALSRATARRSGHAVEKPAPLPWHCAVLAIDTAKRSGWAIYCKGKLQESGEVDTLDEATLSQITRNAVGYAAECGVPIVLALEAPWGGSVDVVAALGVARERWLRAWRQAEQSPARVVRVMPSTWRGAVLGRGWPGAAREEVRAKEVTVARAFVGRAVGPDEAPAILIGRWASQAAVVGKAIGKRAAKASLRAWTERAHG